MAQPRLDRDNLAPPFQLDELERALKQMKAGKARDKSGIVAEMLKVDCHFACNATRPLQRRAEA